MIPGILAGGIPAARPVGEVILSTGAPNFVIPAGVNIVHCVIVGRPGAKRQVSANEWRGGGGGSLSWRNNISCAPGQSVVFEDLSGANADGSYCRLIINGVVVLVAYNGSGANGGSASPPGTYPDYESYAGGSAAATNGAFTCTGGGSAGGYKSNGVSSQAVPAAPFTGSLIVTSGLTGAGGSGGSAAGTSCPRQPAVLTAAGQGGGTTLYGLLNGDDIANNGLGGRVGTNTSMNGMDGSRHTVFESGFGGGDPGSPAAVTRYISGCRIIWGDGRSYPYAAAPV